MAINVDSCVWPHLVFSCLQCAKIPFLHTASNRKLDGRKAWEQGYVCGVCDYTSSDYIIKQVVCS